MKFNIITFGCKVNQYESNMMKENMLHHNFSYVDNFKDADIIIVNTCTVTNTADKKCLRTIKSIINKDLKKILVVTGCSSQNKQDIYKNLAIDILIGNNDKSKIGLLVSNYLKTKEKYVHFINKRNTEFEDMFIKDYNHVRAFIKIEDGCDNFCSFCIIPYVRGSVRSKDFDCIIKEAECLVKNNHKEIVLTGIHTGHYNNNNKDLSDLIIQLSKIKGLERIRISSIEITELNDKFMEVLKTCNKLCSHLHIPLQSGSDKVLKLMNRKYDLDFFYKKLDTIRSIRKDISITTDIIVGHPGEDEADFKNTLKVARELGFSKIHVFPYSKREGTVASKMDNQVDESVKRTRVRELMLLSDELEKDYYDSFKGKEVDVLIETNKDGQSFGHTSNFLEVKLKEDLKVGNIYKRVL